MSTVVRPLRSGVLVAGALALAFAGWACASSSGGASSHGGAGPTCAGGTGGSDAGPCLPSSVVPAPPPKKTCDPCKDVYTECPLPPSQMMPSNGSYSTVYYFSDPVCRSGVCSYCVTETHMEDPCATGVCH